MGRPHDRTPAYSSSPTANHGMVERFNGRISEEVETERFDSSTDLEDNGIWHFFDSS